VGIAHSLPLIKLGFERKRDYRLLVHRPILGMRRDVPDRLRASKPSVEAFRGRSSKHQRPRSIRPRPTRTPCHASAAAWSGFASHEVLPQQQQAIIADGSPERNVAVQQTFSPVAWPVFASGAGFRSPIRKTDDIVHNLPCGVAVTLDISQLVHPARLAKRGREPDRSSAVFPTCRTQSEL
jgi:hypothetical protein